MIAEYSLVWLSPDKVPEFEERFQQVCRYAHMIDYVTDRNLMMDDFTSWVIWNEHKSSFRHLPKFQVRTDIEGESGAVPPRTRVYIPQDDPWGMLQFAWGGCHVYDDGSRYYGGRLDESETLNELGQEAMGTVGQSHIWPWDDGAGAIEFLRSKGIRNRHGEEVGDERQAVNMLGAALYERGVYDPKVSGVDMTTRPCKWYYVELLEGEYEDTNEPETAFVPSRGAGMYAKTGETCPFPGVWECVEHPIGQQTIGFGVRMPPVDGQDVTWRLARAV